MRLLPRVLIGCAMASAIFTDLSAKRFWSYGDEGEPMVEQLGVAIHGLQLSVRTDRGEFTAGAAIPLQLTLKNVGEETAFIPVGRVLEDYQIHVTDSSGKKVELTNYGASQLEPSYGSNSYVELKTGESARAVIKDLSKIYSLDSDREYKVVVHRLVLAGGNKSDRGQAVSNAVIIKIVQQSPN